MNKANKTDARHTVVQAIQRNWQGYQRSLNKQQSFGIKLSEKDITCLFSKS